MTMHPAHPFRLIYDSAGELRLPGAWPLNDARFAFALVFACVFGENAASSGTRKNAGSLYCCGSKCAYDCRDAFDRPDVALSTELIESIRRSFGAGAVDNGRLAGAGVLPAYMLRLRVCPEIRDVVESGLAVPTRDGTALGGPTGGAGYVTPAVIGAA